MATKRKTQRARTGSSTKEDAIALLSADHRKVEKLFKQYEKASGSNQKRALAAQICNELTIHTMLEEEIFYPACRKKGVEADDLDEAQVEHDTAKVLIADLKAETPREEYYDAKMTVLTEYIKHHVTEEEQPRTGIFAMARKAKLDLLQLGEQLRERKAQLSQEVGSNQLPKPTLQALHIEHLG